MTDNKSFSEALLHFRAEHDLTQAQLGEILGKTAKDISRYETGKVKPHAAQELKMREMLKKWGK